MRKHDLQGYNYDLGALQHYINNQTKSGGRLKTTGGIPTWAPDGNQITTHSEHFPLSITDPHYNMLYATLSEPDWPVPRPLTNPSDIGRTYTSAVGDIARTMNFNNESDVDVYYLICIDPTQDFPVSVYQSSSANNARMDLNTPDGLVSNGAGLTGYQVKYNVPFVQTDPRVLIQGDGLVFRPDPQVAFSTQKKFQAMGGKIDISLSVAWNNSAQVGICDPLLAPNRFGNKMPSFAPTPPSTLDADYYTSTSQRDRQLYVPTGSIGASGSTVVQSYFGPTNALASRKVQLVGGGNSSRLNTTTRYVPNTQTWVPSRMFSPPFLDQNLSPEDNLSQGPNAFSGNGMISIIVPPNSGIIIDVQGWLSYNIEVMPGLASGNLLALECPLACGHMSDVVNVPMTFGLSFDSARIADNSISMAYTGHAIPQRLPTSAGVKPVTAERATVGDIQTVLNKFRPLVSTLAPKLVSGYKTLMSKGMSLLGPMVASLAKRLPGVAVKMAPLLLA
jgi:hypothetical protein